MIDRIKQVIDYSQLSASAFADTIGISRSGMTHLLTGRNQPSLDVARKILAKYPEVSTEWLIMGMGEMLRVDEPQQQPQSAASIEEPKTASEAYPDENSKISAQFDLFGEYAAPDDSEEDVAAPIEDMEETPSEEQADDEADTADEEVEEQEEEPDAVPVPVVTPAQPARVPAAPARPRKASAEARPVSAPARRERHTPAPPQEKKLQKIVFFYDDHSFEVYFN